jgi:hypothetical protein
VTITVLSCDTVEEEPNYTYSIDSVWWSDTIDGNSDGFPQFERLNFNVKLKENTSQNISGRVYYKLKEASNFSFYAFSEDKRIIGGDEDNFLFVSIGSPNKELQKGTYDFSIEVFQNNQSDIKAEPDSLQLVALSNKQFEQSEYDNTFSLNVSWADQYDRTGNGYNRRALMIINVNNNENVTRNLDAKIYYNRSEENEFQFYKERLNFAITGDSETDTIVIPIGAPNNVIEGETEIEEVSHIKLEYGKYDFRIDLTEAGKTSLLAFADMENPLLKEQKFESEDEDTYYFTVTNLWWSDSTDMDGDSYTSARKINFDIDVDKSVEQNLYAKIYLRVHQEDPDSNEYDIKYDSTSNFKIFGSNVDPFYTWIGRDTTVLDSNKYDVLISIYSDTKVDTIDLVETTISGFSNVVLTNQSFETASQDSL